MKKASSTLPKDAPASLHLKDGEGNTVSVVDCDSIEAACFELLHGAGDDARFATADVKQGELFICYAFHEEGSTGWQIRRLAGKHQVDGVRA